jgi:ABC-type lipoprotein export system ATPase subunit
MNVIEAHDLFCLYPTPHGHVAALRGLTLDLAPAERLLVHGPNGSGKTTLMRVLTGEVAPSAGTVMVGGTDLVGMAPPDLARLRSRGLGIVEQQRSLRPEISVLANVALQSRLGGASRRDAHAAAAELLDVVGLGRLARRSPGTLSGGEAQRVAVCAALAHRPAVLLADEPTGELDRRAADDVYDLMVTAASAVGAALLLVSHDARAARIAHRVVRIRDGRLSEEWRPGHPESLVVDDRGWVRLPAPLRRSAGIGRVTIPAATTGTITLTSPGAPQPVGTADASGRAVAHTADGPTRHGLARTVAEMRGISVSRGGRTIASGLDVTIRAGEWTVLKGRSGSGKTTLLRLLAGLERPDSGSVTVLGTDLAGLDRTGLAALRRRGMSVAGQRTALVETLDVDANLALARTARGLDPHAGLDDLIAALGLGGLRRRPVELLSGGERQRVAVARALACEAPIVLLDEPTSQQDEAHAELVAAALRAAARRGIAVVVATHDPALLPVAG